MARYKCNVCGFIYDEEEQGVLFSQLKECPVCRQPASAFSLYEEVEEKIAAPAKAVSLDYTKEYVRHDEYNVPIDVDTLRRRVP